MAEDVPTFGSQSKRAKIATHLFEITSILGTAWGTKLDTILYITEILHLFRQWEQIIPVYKNVSIFSREEKRPFTNTLFRNSSPERLIYFRNGSWKMMNTTFISFERKKNVMLYLHALVLERI